MARAGDVLEAPALGVRIEFRRTTEDTGGELVEFDVVGRPRGIITTAHVHPRQSERHEVIEGSFVMRTGGLERVLAPGEVIETAAGTPHRHTGDGRVRVQVRPAAEFEPWLERLVTLDREGQLLPGGWPRPVAAARLLLDFDGEAHRAAPPLRVQQVAARAIVRAAQRRR
jgi:quercetin dioxygenase-like cupin family protein